MLNKNILFKSFLPNKKELNNNIKKVKRTFENFKKDYKNLEIPILESYEKNYRCDFSTETLKRFSKYQNIIVIGMGGSILGTKSIYSFLEKKN